MHSEASYFFISVFADPKMFSR